MGGGGLSGPNFVLRDVRTVPYLKFHPHSNWFPSIEVSVVVYMDGRLLKKILCQQFLGSDWRDRQDLKRIISVAVVIVFFCGDEEVRKPRQRKHCQKSKGLARKGADTFHIHRKTMKEWVLGPS